MKPICIFSIACLLMFGLNSCQKYLDINQNPNAAQEAPIAGLLANVTYTSAYNTYYISHDATSYYVQYLASPNPGSDVDTYQPIDPSTAWSQLYNTLTDLYDMRKLAVSRGLHAYMGVADILTAYNLSLGTDIWGDMPYSQAFQGVVNLTPHFDDQQGLYDTCLALIDRGIQYLQQPDATGELDAASDFIHHGNAQAWIKTAYALKARMLNLVSKTSAYNPSAVLGALAQAYDTSADDAQITEFAVRNPWAQVALNNAGLLLDGWLSSYFIDALDGKTYGVFDPRLPLITDTTVYGDYRGTPNGAGRQSSGTGHQECYLIEGKFYSADNGPLEMITYAECKFIEAEAAFRSGDVNRAYQAYLTGIRVNMEKMQVPDTGMQRYLSDPRVAVGTSNLTLSLIMKEKYVACFLNPVTWDDMRRMDYAYQNFQLPVNAALSTFIRRVDYPSVETTRNGENVPAVQLSDHLWWDK
ncbi:MAG: SusD/RagB family nutrient-binding outer membrane lipoprotein [Thermoflavifilum sp.]|uniref:SusD/RagB family nutrient-binding outer membrane lipoprotein n=1 Tax=Thermoflavifilum sp. TaxID=1968839 RepID=UPI0018A63C14|nr:SusD/RagB family nutrient-binding outer membrane lipoprotein [Thermoflavifilum sp.]QOR75325.1 MAG: SusD/RagB family nutrient-binding outer membrane lipoprotein [Thermoflavifilum sp.]